MYALQPFGFQPAPSFSPLFRLLDSWSQELDSYADSPNWPAAAPPYELSQRDDDSYALTLAVPGFRDKDLSVEVDGDRLHVRGAHEAKAKDAADAKADKKNVPAVRGFAAQQFHRQFQLGEHVRISDAKLADGLLTIQLTRDVPAKAKPRQIKIARG